MSVLTIKTVTFAAGQSDSGIIDCHNFTPVGIYLDTAMTGTSFKFLACDDAAGTFLVVTDGFGSDVSKTFAASKFLPLDPSVFCGIHHLKLRSNGTEAAIRTVRVIGRQV